MNSSKEPLSDALQTAMETEFEEITATEKVNMSRVNPKRYVYKLQKRLLDKGGKNAARRD